MVIILDPVNAINAQLRTVLNVALKINALYVAKDTFFFWKKKK